MSTTLALAALSVLGFSAVAAAQDVPPADTEVVVLLHGLARNSSSMSRLARSLESAGYRVCNLSYPSRKHPIEKLTNEFVAAKVRALRLRRNAPSQLCHPLAGRHYRAAAGRFSPGHQDRPCCHAEPTQSRK